MSTDKISSLNGIASPCEFEAAANAFLAAWRDYCLTTPQAETAESLRATTSAMGQIHRLLTAANAR